VLRHENRSREVKPAPSMTASDTEYKPNFAGGSSYIRPEISESAIPSATECEPEQSGPAA